MKTATSTLLDLPLQLLLADYVADDLYHWLRPESEIMPKTLDYLIHSTLNGADAARFNRLRYVEIGTAVTSDACRSASNSPWKVRFPGGIDRNVV
jgi:hypothetical protein